MSSLNYCGNIDSPNVFYSSSEAVSSPDKDSTVLYHLFSSDSHSHSGAEDESNLEINNEKVFGHLEPFHGPEPTLTESPRSCIDNSSVESHPYSVDSPLEANVESAQLPSIVPYYHTHPSLDSVSHPLVTSQTVHSDQNHFYPPAWPSEVQQIEEPILPPTIAISTNHPTHQHLPYFPSHNTSNVVPNNGQSFLSHSDGFLQEISTNHVPPSSFHSPHHLAPPNSSYSPISTSAPSYFADSSSNFAVPASSLPTGSRHHSTSVNGFNAHAQAPLINQVPLSASAQYSRPTRHHSSPQHSPSSCPVQRHRQPAESLPRASNRHLIAPTNLTPEGSSHHSLETLDRRYFEAPSLYYPELPTPTHFENKPSGLFSTNGLHRTFSSQRYLLPPSGGRSDSTSSSSHSRSPSQRHSKKSSRKDLHMDTEAPTWHSGSSTSSRMDLATFFWLNEETPILFLPFAVSPLHPIIITPETSETSETPSHSSTPEEYTPLFQGPITYEDRRYNHLKSFYSDFQSSGLHSHQPTEDTFYHFEFLPKTHLSSSKVGRCRHSCPTSTWETAPTSNQLPSFGSASSYNHPHPLNSTQFLTQQAQSIPDSAIPLTHFCQDGSSFSFASESMDLSDNAENYDSAYNGHPSLIMPNVNLPNSQYVDMGPNMSAFSASSASHPQGLSVPHKPDFLQTDQYLNFDLACISLHSPQYLRKSAPVNPCLEKPLQPSSHGKHAKSPPSDEKLDLPSGLKSPTSNKVLCWNLNGQVLTSPDFSQKLARASTSVDHHSNLQKSPQNSKSFTMELKFQLQRKRIVLEMRRFPCRCKHTISLSFFDIASFILHPVYLSREDFRNVNEKRCKYVALTLAITRPGDPKCKSYNKSDPPTPSCPAIDEEEGSNGFFHESSYIPPTTPYATVFPSDSPFSPLQTASEASDSSIFGENAFMQSDNLLSPSSGHPLHFDDSMVSEKVIKATKKGEVAEEVKCVHCDLKDNSVPYHPLMGRLVSKCPCRNNCDGGCMNSVFMSRHRHHGEQYFTFILEKSSFTGTGTQTRKPCSLEKILLLDPYLAHIARVAQEYVPISMPRNMPSIPPLALLRDRFLCQLEAFRNYMLYYTYEQVSRSIATNVNHDFDWCICTKPCCQTPISSATDGHFTPHKAASDHEIYELDRRSSLRATTVAQASVPHNRKPHPSNGSFAWYPMDLSRLAAFRHDDSLQSSEIHYSMNALHLGHSRTITFPTSTAERNLPFDYEKGLIVTNLLPAHEWKKIVSEDDSGALSPGSHPFFSSEGEIYRCPLGCEPCYCSPSTHELENFIFPPWLSVSPESMSLFCPAIPIKTKKNKKHPTLIEEEKRGADTKTKAKRACSRTTPILSKHRLETLFGPKIRRLYDDIPI